MNCPNEAVNLFLDDMDQDRLSIAGLEDSLSPSQQAYLAVLDAHQERRQAHIEAIREGMMARMNHPK